MSETNRDLYGVVEEIKERLTTIEDYLVWLIKAEQRFRLGQRVEFSRRAHRCQLGSSATRAKKGVVKAVDGISVLLDIALATRRAG